MNRRKTTPPHLAQKLLCDLLREDLVEEVLGDLEEKFYATTKDRSLFKAKLNYWYQVTHYLRPFAIRKSSHHINLITMYKHYSLATIRNISRNKLTALINILGLALGMSACLLIYQYVRFETSFDTFHKEARSITRVVTTSLTDGEDNGTHVYTNYTLGPLLKENSPDVQEFVRIHPPYNSVIVREATSTNAIQEDEMFFVDPSFLSVFDFPFVLGNRATALQDKNNIVISEEMALRHFRDENPLGKILTVNTNYTNGNYTVSGVLKSIPTNTHLQFDFLLPIVGLLETGQYTDGWYWENFFTYFKLKPDADINYQSELLLELIAKQYDEDIKEVKTGMRIDLQAIDKTHLYSEHIQEDYIATNNGQILTVRVFSIIAIFILVIAWVNYINLSAAHAINRSKEVGIRKSIGAHRKQILSQFIVEALIINTCAAILAACIAYAMLPQLNHLLGTSLTFELFEKPTFWLSFVSFILFGSLLTGFYPALILSKFKPSSVFKLNAGTTIGGVNLRRGMITVQFFVAIVLIAGTYLVYQQVSFLQNQSDGIDKEQLLIIQGPKAGIDKNLNEQIKTLKNGISNHHSVGNVTASGAIPGSGYNWQTTTDIIGDSTEKSISSRIILVDEDFASTMGMEILAGNNFTNESRWFQSVLINEEASKAYGFANPMDAVGKQIRLAEAKVNILGVVKNFHWHSLHDPFSPYILRLTGSQADYFTIKINLSNPRETITHVEEAFHITFPNNPFSYFFLDEQFNRQFQTEKQFLNLFTVLSLLAIFIASMGLFAIVVFSTNQRKKEVSVRKVLGASMNGLMWLLSSEYLILLLIANLLAAPLIWVFGEKWLEAFAFRIDLQLIHIFLPGVLLLLIAALTVSYRTYKTAISNPSDSLRTEL
ncbi:MAG: ABC transporter permease [Cyclobacteriaceae bacterium]